MKFCRTWKFEYNQKLSAFWNTTNNDKNNNTDLYIFARDVISLNFRLKYPSQLRANTCSMWRNQRKESHRFCHEQSHRINIIEYFCSKQRHVDRIFNPIITRQSEASRIFEGISPIFEWQIASASTHESEFLRTANFSIIKSEVHQFSLLFIRAMPRLKNGMQIHDSRRESKINVDPWSFRASVFVRSQFSRDLLLTVYTRLLPFDLESLHDAKIRKSL